MEVKTLFLKYLKSLKCEKIFNNVYIDKFLNFFYELKNWNEKHNLIGLKNDSEILIKLFIDSLFFIKTNIVSQCETILDVGTGAGFPSIPNAIYLENKNFGLVDSNKKKCFFLTQIKNKINILNIEIINERAEILARNDGYREKFDCALIKAFNPFNIAMEIILPLIKINGFCVYYASKNQEKNIISNKEIQKTLGFNFHNIYSYELPENCGERCLIIVKKLWKTNDKYPRKYKNIKLKPL